MATAFSKLHKVDRDCKTSGKRNGCAAKEGEIFKKLLIIEKVVLTILIKGARSQHFNYFDQVENYLEIKGNLKITVH